MARSVAIPSIVRSVCIAAAAAAIALGGCGSKKEPARGVEADSPSIAALSDNIVANHRRIIVLVEGEGGLTPAERDAVPLLGHHLFRANHELADALGRRFAAGIARKPPDPSEIVSFLDALENGPDWHDADKLAFAGLLDEIGPGLLERAAGDSSLRALSGRVDEDRAALREIQALYDKELERIFARIETRGMTVRREKWESYVADLASRHSPSAILREFAPSVPGLAEALKKPLSAPLVRRETFGRELPPKTVALTFDDGPHPRFTDRVLSVLKEHEVPWACFFEVGRNIGAVSSDNAVTLGAGAAVSRRIVDAGMTVANHTRTHALLTKLDAKGCAEEIDQTGRLIARLSPGGTGLFRAPYGARNDNVRAALAQRKLRSVMWNIDSRDWADPVPMSIANRVIRTVEAEGRGIILFHDIHARTVEALPSILETLKSRGYRFAAWNGSGFEVREAKRSLDPAPGGAAAKRDALPVPYRESWAAVIGIDDYANWPKLRYAVNDARAVVEILVRRFGFAPDHVFTLFDRDATRENILSLLGDRLADPARVKRDDRVFVFYAGHGATRKLPSGRELGYIIPVEADAGGFQGKAISMTNFQDIAEAVPAKHLFFVMDSCFSGLALTRGGAGTGFAAEMAKRSAREVLTAGGADQEVADGGPNGHSIFTWTLLQALEGKGDLNGDGLITASELAAYVGPVVSSLSRQTPAFGNLPGSEGGDFLFASRRENEFLSGETPALGPDAIRLNSEIERLRAQLAEKDRQNEVLRKTLISARNIRSPKTDKGRSTAGRGSVNARNDRGVALFREKRYAEALGEFLEAARIDPGNALAANNAGYACYMLGDDREAVKWFRKAIDLDPARAVAWANLGDSQARMGRAAEARTAYETFLALQPESKGAPKIREKLAALK